MYPSMETILEAMKKKDTRHSIRLFGLKLSIQKDITFYLMKNYPKVAGYEVLDEFYNKGTVHGDFPYCFTFHYEYEAFKYISYTKNLDGTLNLDTALRTYNGYLVEKAFIKWEPVDEPKFHPDIWV